LNGGAVISPPWRSVLKRAGSVLAILVVFALLLPWPGPTLSAERSPEGRPSLAVVDKVNINTAEVKQLMTLEGVGRKLAEKIVEYRKAHGPFTKPEQLRKVEGVGAGLWERNRDRVVVK
jgi:competence protein ComEA